jgi:hypothetical protein
LARILHGSDVTCQTGDEAELAATGIQVPGTTVHFKNARIEIATTISIHNSELGLELITFLASFTRLETEYKEPRINIFLQIPAEFYTILAPLALF